MTVYIIIYTRSVQTEMYDQLLCFETERAGVLILKNL